MSNLVWFKDEKRGITGRICPWMSSVIDGLELFTAMCYACQPVDIRYITEAASQALGFPVEISQVLYSDYHNIEFRRVSPEKVALREKIAACRTVEYWFVPRCELMGVMAEDLGKAILHKYQGVLDGDFDVATWVVDASGVSPAFLRKWVDQAIEIAISAMRKGWREADWNTVYSVLMIASTRNPDYRTAEIAALQVILKYNRCAPAAAQEEIVSLCRSHGLEFARELHKVLNEKFREFLYGGYPPDVRKILRDLLDDGISGGREGNPELAEIEKNL